MPNVPPIPIARLSTAFRHGQQNHNDISTRVALKLIPAAVILPVILGWLVYQGEQQGWYGSGWGMALLSALMIIAALVLMQCTVETLDQLDDRCRLSEERLRLALQGAEQGTWDWNLETQVLTWDDRCKEIFGLSSDSAITYDWHLNALHPDDRQQVEDAGSASLREHSKFKQEYRTIHPDGAVRWVLAQGQGYYNDRGEAYRMSGTVLDVTDRKQALTDLQERTAHIQLLYETTRDLLSTTEPLSLVESLFSKLSLMIGLDIYLNYLLDESQQKLRLIFHGGISEETAEQIEWLEMGQAICGAVAEQKQQIVRSDLQSSNDSDSKAQLFRELGLAAYSCQPLLAHGKFFGTLSFGSHTRTDFTPAEKKLFQAICDQIAIALERAELMSSLQHQTIELIHLNRLKDEFLAALSHELRTPLNPILGWTTLMKAKKLSPVKTTEALEIIERNVRQQMSIINDLLVASSATQGKLNLKACPVNLTEVVTAAINTVAVAAQAKGITIHVSHYPEESDRPSFPLHVTGDSDRLQQVFWNLLSNAIKFTPHDGRIDVKLSIVSSKNSAAQIQISDNGIGIAPEFLPRVFDHFRQADGSTTRKYGGLGLGLAIVRRLVELHGGSVDVESSGKEQGSTFIVRLPLCSPMAELSNEEAALRLGLEAMSIAPNAPILVQNTVLAGVYILLVDDEPDNLTLLRLLLQEEGAIVTALTDPVEAIASLVQHLPDLIISDIAMQTLDGYEFMRQVRGLPQGQEIPAVALTAFVQHLDPEEAFSAGFQVCLSKPVDLTQLLNTLTNLVQR
jgi:PAS domain S-box-containing protein